MENNKHSQADHRVIVYHSYFSYSGGYFESNFQVRNKNTHRPKLSKCLIFERNGAPQSQNKPTNLNLSLTMSVFFF